MLVRQINSQPASSLKQNKRNQPSFGCINCENTAKFIYKTPTLHVLGVDKKSPKALKQITDDVKRQVSDWKKTTKTKITHIEAAKELQKFYKNMADITIRAKNSKPTVAKHLSKFLGLSRY